MLARSDIDAVILATPDQYRLEITAKAAAAGKHVLVEKPMAPTVAECDEMIRLCDQAGVNLGVVKTERFRTITRKAKALIDDGTIRQRSKRTLDRELPIQFRIKSEEHRAHRAATE